MNKGLIFTLGFILGGAGGGLVVNTILKQAYQQKADEEITACRNAFLAEMEKRREEAQKKEHEEKKEAAAKAIETYSNEPEKASEQILKSDEKRDKAPYVIPPDVYEDPNNPYRPVGLRYFPKDGAVIRDDDSLMNMEDLDACVGREALTHFGDYEPDRVCIRNEKFNCDYEILLQQISYEDFLKTRSSDGK